MVEPQRPTTEQAAQPSQHDHNEQQHGEHQHPERLRDDQALQAARQRASLKKEIRAGWQRALGH